MSAFNVSKKCIDLAVHLMTSTEAAQSNHYKERDMLGAQLAEMNAAAVAARYVEPPAPQDEYKHEYHATNPAACYKAACCLHYQCSEGKIPSWALYQRLTAAIHAAAHEIVSNTREYKDAEWCPTDDPTHAKKLIRIM